MQKTIQINQNAQLKMFLWDDSAELRVAKRPAVLVCPGGGYMMCSDREAEPIALAYYAEGFQTFVLRYSVNTSFSEPFSEAEQALRMIREHREDWHIGENQVAVIGFSAGGHLACSLGTISKHKPNAMILGYPAVLGKAWEQVGRDAPDLVGKVTGETPPTFIFGACDDRVVPMEHEISLMSALDRCNVPFECHIYHKGGHGFSLAKKHTSSGSSDYINPRCENWFRDSIVWLKETIGDVETLPQRGLPDGCAASIEIPIAELMQNPATAKVLMDFNPVFSNKVIMQMAGDAPLKSLIVSLGVEDDVIIRVSETLQNILTK